jgi:hypothetical protein
MTQSLPRLILLFTVLLVVSVGCTAELISEETLLRGIESTNRFLDSPFVRSLPRIAPIAAAVVVIGLLLFARGVFFRAHSAMLAGTFFAGILGVAAGVIGFIGSYASIYAVNRYFEGLIGLSHGTVITALGGALVGIIGMIGAIFVAIIAIALVSGLVSVLTGSSVDIPILDRWNMPTGLSLHIWTPGDVGGAEDGGLGCTAVLSPGFLIAPIVGAYAGVRLQDGNPLDITNTPFFAALICSILVGFVGLIAGMRTGWMEGGSKFGGVIVGAFYGYLIVRTFGDDLGLHSPTFLRIISYIVGVVLFASIGNFLAPDKPEDGPRIIFYIVLVITLLGVCGALILWLMNAMDWIW